MKGTQAQEHKILEEKEINFNHKIDFEKSEKNYENLSQEELLRELDLKLETIYELTNVNDFERLLEISDILKNTDIERLESGAKLLQDLKSFYSLTVSTITEAKDIVKEVEAQKKGLKREITRIQKGNWLDTQTDREEIIKTYQKTKKMLMAAVAIPTIFSIFFIYKLYPFLEDLLYS